jgi:lipid A ethanolaminephosphotransferase
LIRSGWRQRPQWRSEWLALAASVFFALLNGPLWQGVLAGRDAGQPSTWGFVALLFVGLVAWQFVLLGLLLNRWTAKPLLSLLLPLAAAAALLQLQQPARVLDPAGVRGLLQGGMVPLQALLAPRWVLSGLLLAGLPLLALWRLRLQQAPRGPALWRRLRLLLVAAAVGTATLLLTGAELSTLMREQPQLRYRVTPANLLVAAVMAPTVPAASVPRQIGLDARLGPHWQGADRPAVLVIVVASSVRAGNWGAGRGSGRQTTPELAAMKDVIHFPHASSCGTSAEVSLPCLFSPEGLRLQLASRPGRSESLLHVMQHAGVDVLWRDNQSSCRGVCDGLPQQHIAPDADPQRCDGSRCLDEVLLQGLAQRLDAAHGAQLLVLRPQANLGPAYFRHYPKAFRRFKPTCDSSELPSCSREQVTNAYDNGLLYLDHVLAQLIELLKSRSATLDSAVIFTADHGESLGENRLYLHGLPRAIAPRQQTEVPLLMWLSPAYAVRFGIDAACLRRRATETAEHDNLFHTALGLLDVQTTLRDPALDLSAHCRS